MQVTDSYLTYLLQAVKLVRDNTHTRTHTHTVSLFCAAKSKPQKCHDEVFIMSEGRPKCPHVFRSSQCHIVRNIARMPFFEYKMSQTLRAIETVSEIKVRYEHEHRAYFQSGFM